MGKEKIAIGFDLGTASVGWSIIKYNEDDKRNCELVNRGVRVFQSIDSQNKERRDARHNRRRIARKNYKQYKLFTILKKYNFVNDLNEYASYIFNQPNNKMPFELKCEVIENNKKLNNHELTYILNSYIKKRGYFLEQTFDSKYQEAIKKDQNLKEELELLKDELETVNKNSKEYIDLQKKINKLKKDIESNNKKIIKEKEKSVEDYNDLIYPCQNQKEWWKKYQKVNFKNNYLFSNKKYIEEIEKIFEIQFQENLKNFQEEVIKLIESKREFYEGPGSEISYSKWGRYDQEGNKLVENLWEKSVGHCSWFPDKERTQINSPKYILFNIINILSNIYFEYKTMKFHLSHDLIYGFLKDFFENKKNISINTDMIIKYIILEKKERILINNYNYDGNFKSDINENIIKIKGFKKEKSKSKNSDEEKYKNTNIINVKIIRIFALLMEKNQKFSFNLESFNFLNSIFLELKKIMAMQTSKEDGENRIKDYFKKNNLLLNLDAFLKLEDSVINIYDIKFWTKTGSLSEYAINLYLEEYFFNEKIDKNKKILDQQSFRMQNKKDTVSDQFKFKYFPKNYFKDEILPPNVKRTFEQSINVFNAILKQYFYNGKYDIEYITIELARDINSKKEKDKLSNIQKENEEFLKKFENERPNEYNLIKDNLKYIIKSSHKFRMLKLWCEQNGKDVYSLKNDHEFEDINITDIFSEKELEIDHIFSYEITNNNSFSNVILTKASNNQEKGKKTPYSFFGTNFYKYKEAWKKIYINNTMQLPSNISSLTTRKEKYDKLVFEGTENDIPSHFFANSLNDTRYVTSLFMNYLKLFCNSNEILNKIKINSINGVITSAFRDVFRKELQESERFDPLRKKHSFENNKDTKNDEIICNNSTLYHKNRLSNEHHSIDATICAILGKEKWALDKEIIEQKNENIEYDENGEIKLSMHHHYIRKHYKNLLSKESLDKVVCKYSTNTTKKINNFKLFDLIPLIAKKFEVENKKNEYWIIKKVSLIDNDDLKKICNDLEKKNNKYQLSNNYLISDDKTKDYLCNILKELCSRKKEKDIPLNIIEFMSTKEQIENYNIAANNSNLENINNSDQMKNLIKIKGIPIIFKDKKDDNYKVVTFIKNLKKKDEKIQQSIDNLFILNNLPKNTKEESIINKYNNEKITIDSNLDRNDKITYYNKLTSPYIVIFKTQDKEEKYIPFYFNVKYSINLKDKKNQNDSIILNMQKFIEEYKAKNINWEYILCDKHKLLNFDLNEKICIECSRNILTKDSKYHLSIYNGKCFYNNSNDNIDIDKIDFANVFYRIGGSQANQKIKLENISKKEVSNTFLNKWNDWNRQLETSEINSQNYIDLLKKIKNPKIEFKDNSIAINSFVESYKYVLDIDPLGNIRKIKKIFS